MLSASARVRSRARPVTIACMLAAIGLMAGDAAATEADLVSVAEAHWTSRIDDGGTYGRTLAHASANHPLYLWTRLKGTGAALAELRAKGKLPIRHQWTSSTGTLRIPSAVEVPTDAITLDVGRPESFDPLQLEVTSRGFFDWRTWSMKQRAFRGLWVVSVVYANGEPVTCDGIPCRYSIRVD
jgi:hypothetical protein